MEISYHDEHFCCWGTGSQGGVYVLRIGINQQREVQFGRFRQGEPIDVAQGDYLYVGSAQAQKGAASLARRLLRHASTGNGTQPHLIRQKMLTLFPQIGLGPMPLHPPSGKKLRWHVDFLLDEPGVALTAVYIIRASRENLPVGSDRAMETAVARWLLSFPEVTPLAAGLGSTDDPGGTHLLQVTAVSTWWSHFPERLTILLQDGLA